MTTSGAAHGGMPPFAKGRFVGQREPGLAPSHRTGGIPHVRRLRRR